MTLRHRPLGRVDAVAALLPLAEWTPATSTAGPLHPGDIGWFLRFDEAQVAAALRLWSDDTGPVAVTLLDTGVLRAALAPRAVHDQRLAEALADEWERLLGDDESWCDAPTGSAVVGAMVERGWQLDPDEPWVHLVATELPGTIADGVALVTAADAADRVAVQRAAFEGSTFTLQRRQLMTDSAAAQLCVDVLVRTADGAAAAGATGWLAGTGRCALLEPVGTHPDHRGRGYGLAAVRGACAELARVGAAAVAVLTPSSNTAAVALYTSAGFAPVGEQRALYRPAG
jgi:ribosomal protein S18 acetylase RimI-like enzyme